MRRKNAELRLQARARKEASGEALGVRCRSDALEHVSAIVGGRSEEAGKAWAEATVRTRVSLEVCKALWAGERGRREEGPQPLGVVVLAQRIEDVGEWERRAREVSRQQAIEGKVLPGKVAS